MSARLTIVAAAALCAACAMSDPNLAPGSGAPSYSPGNAMPPTLSSAANDLAIPTWQWQGAAAPERYTLKFEGGGRVLLRADCNRGSGAYEVNGGAMKLSPAAVTKMGCPPGSQDSEFLQALSRVTGYAIEGKELTLTLSGGGSMRFRAVP